MHIVIMPNTFVRLPSAPQGRMLCVEVLITNQDDTQRLVAALIGKEAYGPAARVKHLAESQHMVHRGSEPVVSGQAVGLIAAVLTLSADSLTWESFLDEQVDKEYCSLRTILRLFKAPGVELAQVDLVSGKVVAK